MSRLICITGPDGAGKSTMIKLLSEKLESVAVSNIWDIMEGGITNVPFKSKKDVDDYLCELTPHSRLLFLAHALKYSTDKAISKGKEYVLLNGYYYKYFASELALGANEGRVNELIGFFPQADKVFYLEVSPEEAAKRKSRLSRYECGLVNEPSVKDFISFQYKAVYFRDFFERSNREIVDTTHGVERILDQVFTRIVNN
jgi:dTMP kinase